MTISRQAAIDAFMTATSDGDKFEWCKWVLEQLPPAQPEVIRCKNCKYYSPMNKETKTGICNLTMHQNFGDNWFCAGVERRIDEDD